MPPFLKGIPDCFRPISTPDSVPANVKSFKEGDLIANGWQLTAIRIEGIEMAKQKRSVFVAYP